MINEQIIEAVVARLKAHAEAEYNNGWDVVVECWDRADHIEVINKVVTTEIINNEDALFKAAKADVQEFVDLYKEQESNTRFE
ncbi:hypothetical protein D3C80_1493340 [compost metagenome]